MARRIDGGGDPIAAWRRAKDDHPKPGTAGADGAGPVRAAATFIERHDLVTIPPAEPLVVAQTPDFYRWTFASLWTPGPFETKPTRRATT